MHLNGKLQSEDFLNGQLLLIDKDLRWTSFDVVNKLRYTIKRKYDIKKIKVGHAGTLDPLASGLLIICTGKFTKRIDQFMGLNKEYTGIIRLGSSTPTYDLESEPDKTYPTEHITDELILKTIEDFTGDIMQMPPIFSAIMKDGQRAYQLARRGEKVELQARGVRVEQFLATLKGKDIHFQITCSKGTYIRSIAHDLGLALGSGAHLAELRRTAIGDYNVRDALSVEQFLNTLDPIT